MGSPDAPLREHDIVEQSGGGDLDDGEERLLVVAHDAHGLLAAAPHHAIHTCSCGAEQASQLEPTQDSTLLMNVARV